MSEIERCGCEVCQSPSQKRCPEMAIKVALSRSPQPDTEQ